MVVSGRRSAPIGYCARSEGSLGVGSETRNRIAIGGTLARVVTAAVLIPAVVAVVLWGSTALVAACLALVTLLALREFFALGEAAGLRGYPLWTCLCAMALLVAKWSAAILDAGSTVVVLRTRLGFAVPVVLPSELVLLVYVLGVAAIALGTRRAVAEALPAMGVSAAGILCVAFPLSYVVRLHAAPSYGPKLLLFTLALIWAGDTLAYFVGRAMGRHRMAPRLSPQKTWEGAVANLLGSLLIAAMFVRWMWIPLEPAHLFLMAGLGNIAGQAGDFLESAYKRSAGVKDSGALLPGHGGMLDRIDALILAAPVVWYYFHCVVSRPIRVL